MLPGCDGLDSAYAIHDRIQPSFNHVLLTAGGPYMPDVYAIRKELVDANEPSTLNCRFRVC